MVNLKDSENLETFNIRKALKALKVPNYPNPF